MVCPSSDICPWPSSSMEQDDIIPLNPPLGTVMRNDMVEPLIVPCIDPFPIMLLLVSLMFIVPVMAFPFWVRAHVMFSRPLVSADVPIHVPDGFVFAAAVGVGAVGTDALPAHAVTNIRLKTTRTDLRMSRSPLGLGRIVETGSPLLTITDSPNRLPVTPGANRTDAGDGRFRSASVASLTPRRAMLCGGVNWLQPSRGQPDDGVAGGGLNRARVLNYREKPPGFTLTASEAGTHSSRMAGRLPCADG